MLIAAALVLLVIWLLGVVGMYPLGGFAYVLPTLSVIMILVRLVRGR